MSRILGGLVVGLVLGGRVVAAYVRFDRPPSHLRATLSADARPVLSGVWCSVDRANDDIAAGYMQVRKPSDQGFVVVAVSFTTNGQHVSALSEYFNATTSVQSFSVVCHPIPSTQARPQPLVESRSRSRRRLSLFGLWRSLVAHRVWDAGSPSTGRSHGLGLGGTGVSCPVGLPDVG